MVSLQASSRLERDYAPTGRSSFFENRQNLLFEVRCWTFDVRCSLVFFPIRPVVLLPTSAFT